MSGTDVYYYLQHGKRLERPSRCPSSIYQIMLKTWEWDEKKRPTFSQLLQSLKTDRESSKAVPAAAASSLSRKKSLKTTLSSSTLTDENNRDNPDEDENNDDATEQKNEQYKSNGNGHVSKTIIQLQQTFSKERTNS